MKNIIEKVRRIVKNSGYNFKKINNIEYRLGDFTVVRVDSRFIGFYTDGDFKVFSLENIKEAIKKASEYEEARRYEAGYIF